MRSQKGFTLIELLIVVAIIGIIAAIAIPSLLRARVSANESATIGDIRTVISSQAAYQSADGGFYTNAITCLLAPATAPAACIPNYPTQSPTFIDSQIGALNVKSGYMRLFNGGVAVAGSLLNTDVSGTTSANTYSYTASPVNQGQTGVRGFGGDNTGMLCFDPKGGMPPINADKTLQVGIAACQLLQ